jgi:hypothetical protein
MKLNVTVKANAKTNEVIIRSDGGLLVKVTAPPVDGKANKKVIQQLAIFFGKPKSAISIVSGRTGKIKIVEIL